jgi:hypothetical protein
MTNVIGLNSKDGLCSDLTMTVFDDVISRASTSLSAGSAKNDLRREFFRRLISTLRLRFVSLLLFILCLINTADAQISSAARDPKIDSAIMIPPFADESGFSGKWKLSEEVPRYLSAYMSEKFRATFISPTTVQLFGETIGVVGNELLSTGILERSAAHFRARYVLMATITEFAIGRFLVGDPGIGGYQSFSADVQFTFKLYDARKLPVDMRKALVAEDEVVGAVRDRGLGITLFGKPTERTSQYYALDELMFGSQEFNKTVIGEAMAKAAAEFAVKFEQIVPELQLREQSVEMSNATKPIQDTAFTLHRKILTGEILVVDSLEVFINLGSDDGLVTGEKISVYAKGEQLRDPKTQAVLGESDLRVGEIQIIEVRAPHLSLCVITKGVGSIAPHQKVRVNVVR